tara:strand:+ start:1790 stop:1915 length:126 start_codon:yes stop_codon:yes gene_type:complete
MQTSELWNTDARIYTAAILSRQVKKLYNKGFTLKNGAQGLI